MILNGSNLTTAAKGFSAIFNKAYTSLLAQEQLWQRIATEAPSTGDSEQYDWLGDDPAMAEFTGEVTFKDLRAFSYTLTNKSYAKGIEVRREVLEDDKLGVIKPRIEGMARGAVNWLNDLVFSQLRLASTGLCYDGQTFAATTHPYGPSGNQSNKGTDALSEASFNAAVLAMSTYQTEEGKPMFIQPDLLVVGPKNRVMANQICKSALREVADVGAGSAVDNVNKGLVEPHVNPYLVGTWDDWWFLMDTKKAVKPLIMQVRKRPQFVAQDQLTAEQVFTRHMLRYAVDARGVAGFGLWQTCYCGIL